MHRVHTVTLVGRPSTRMMVDWMFGRKARLVCRLEKLTLCPNCGFLPQTSQIAMVHHLLSYTSDTGVPADLASNRGI